MDDLINNKYEDITFTEVQNNMFSDLVESDIALKRVLMVIAKHSQTHKDNEVSGGITVKDITEQIILDRKVRKGKKGFTTETTYINRKHAERVVETLLKMSLCYKVPFTHPSKLIYPTVRGISVSKELTRRYLETSKGR
ncbi:hypothetical protein [Paenibacillus thiaminolyticus]|uniref:Uncharacterized protein n=1 Tax=Paenibacillus thiaminolyticus TaxID=49283 RepID=A0A3A3GH06_PANTH|nr:hypothetical protein [Paenibacillus thiaminolyticus]RJG21336.1 hypothetical protein DQX05_21785 [Paenibacillus thiaminolyticus]